jgi:threonine aldolase
MQGIAEIPGLVTEPVHTNIVYFRFAPETDMSEAEFVGALEERNVRLFPSGKRRFRAVTHCWIDADDIQAAINAIRQVMNGKNP